MPRNGSGSMSLTTTFVANTPALAADINTVLQDIRDEITNSVAKDGQTTITGALKCADGTISAPGVAFASDLNTGFYRSASGVIRASLDGTNTLTLTATGATVTGTASVSGVATVGGLTVGAITNAHVPSGVICMWSGSVASIPTGWYLCNGSNGTPDLRDKFVIGAKQDDSGTAKTNVEGSLTQSGGSKDAVNVSHTHTASVTDPGHTHNAGTSITVNTGSSSNVRSTATTTTATGSATTGITVSNSTEGSSGTNANLPPYYALAFIMKA